MFLTYLVGSTAQKKRKKELEHANVNIKLTRI